MLKALLLFVFFSLSLNLLAQHQACQVPVLNRRLDSLNVLLKKGELNQKEAILTLEKIEVCFKSLNNELGLLYCNKFRIDLFIKSYNTGSALALLQKIFPPKVEKGLRQTVPSLLADFLYQRGVCYREILELSKAQDDFMQATQLYLEQKNWERYIDACLATTGVAFQSDQPFNIIEEYIENAYQTAKLKLKPDALVFRLIYQAYASVYFEEGDYDKAVKFAKKGLEFELAQPQIDSLLLGHLYYDLGLFHESKLDYDYALFYFQAALPLFEHHQNDYSVAELLRAIASLYFHQKKLAQAQEQYWKCLKLVKEIGWHPKHERQENLFTYIGVCEYYLRFNKIDSLLNYINPLVPDIEKYILNPPMAYKAIGLAYEKKGELKKAELYLRKMLNYQLHRFGQHGGSVAESYYRLAELSALNKDWDNALFMLDSVMSSLAVPINLLDANILDLEHALDRRELFKGFRERGRVLMAKQAYHQAHQSFQQAISLMHYLKDSYVSDASKHYSLEALRPLYELATHAALERHKENSTEPFSQELLELIFENAEHSKATLLNESLIKFRSHYYDFIGIADSLLRQEENLLRDLDNYREKLFSAQQLKDSIGILTNQKAILDLQEKLERFEAFLEEQHPNYKSLQEMQHNIVKISSVQRHLDETSVFVEYFVSEAHVFIFYITKDTTALTIIENHSLDELHLQIHELRASLCDLHYLRNEVELGYKLFTANAYQIFKDYLEHPILNGKKKLIIVPDREFNYIPFEVLLMNPAPKNGVNYADLDYLIKDYTIRYEYSATVMLNSSLDDRKRGNGRVLGFAPIYGQDLAFSQLPATIQKERSPKEIGIHANLTELQGAKEEIEMLQKLTNGDFFIGEKAVESALKKLKGNYSVIHLAMHGIVDIEHPAYSALVFTEDLDSLEDNLLYAYEINHLDYRQVDLVVLSACQTGYGRYDLGEGIISLGRSFMHAGVGSIVSTLWELNDNSSMEIMQHFYKNLNRGMQKDEALRAAKLAYLEKNKGIAAHPFFWAALVQIGDPSPIVLYLNHAGAWKWLLLGTIGFVSFLTILYYALKKRRAVT